MTPSLFPYSHCAAALVAITAVAAQWPAYAGGGASAWDAGSNSTMRLVAGGPVRNGNRQMLQAGVEIKLKPGWKTYWRYPGDSGVPPRFDFSGSTNVKDVSVLWPAPSRFSDGSGMSIGYTDAVMFPLRIEPADPTSPVTLRLKLDYAVCEKLCVPVDAKAELPISSAPTEYSTAIAASEERVPRRVTIGEKGPLTITKVRRREGDKARVIVDVLASPQAKADLFVEGPTPDWSLPLPERIARGPDGLWRFAFDLDGLPPGVTAKGAMLTLTAVTTTAAIEVVAKID